MLRSQTLNLTMLQIQTTVYETLFTYFMYVTFFLLVATTCRNNFQKPQITYSDTTGLASSALLETRTELKPDNDPSFPS